MDDKCQNQQMQNSNPWQYPPYGMFNGYAGQGYGHPGYGPPGQYYYYPGMGFNPNNSPSSNNSVMHNTMNPSMMNKSYPPGFGPSNMISNQHQQEGEKHGERNDLPPLPPGPPPPPTMNNFPNPPPPGTTPVQQQFFNQPANNPYGPIKFNLHNKKPGLGFKPFNANSPGPGKKKRKRNRNNQFNMSNNNVGVFPSPPPLPVELPPPLPPLPPGEDDVVVLGEEGPALTATSNEKPSVPTAVSSSPAIPGSDWPDSLKNYVNRCYDKCIETVDKDQVEIILKGKITRAANDGSLWIKNWDLEPLPSLHSERKFIEIKKPLQSPINHNKRGAVRGKKSGISASLGSRLGVRNNSYRGRRSKSRSRSRSHSHSPPFRRRNRSRSSDDSPSPSRGGRRSVSSSSSDDNFKSLRTNKPRDGPKITDRLTPKKRNLIKQKGKGKMNKGLKSHFYSEFGLAGTDDLGNCELLQKRAARFSNSLKTPSPSPGIPQRRKRPLSLGSSFHSCLHDDTNADIDWSEFHVVGTCQDLEKPYLRLTSAPDASMVRPVDILKNSLLNVKERWKKNHDYRYACDQMKSIRQDLTVQGVRDQLSVEVYEVHARIALEKGDHEEFNQCQTQLRMLYPEVGGANQMEFTAYRILYYMFTSNTQDLTTILSSLKPEHKVDECVSHALALRSAWWLGNYHQFFKLYKMAPRMSSYLVDWFIDRERKAALKTMIKAYVYVINGINTKLVTLMFNYTLNIVMGMLTIRRAISLYIEHSLRVSMTVF
uniref:(California timema) hypothetical protein n=1 Tax=Timema californicum TaxID=61474 RepID=A0A7R9J009_TIMCA|nr:unnamed protein product [Timema californicum]